MAKFVFLDQSGNPLDVAFDAIIREEHSRDAIITDNPVENGSEVTDHMQILPSKLVLEIGVSDLIQAGERSPSGAGTKSASTWENLEKLQDSREPFNVSTGLKLYKNMQIENMVTSRDRNTGKALPATLTLKELIIIETKIVSANFRSPKSDGTHARVTQATNLGETLPETPTIEEEAKAATILKQLLN